MMERAMGFEPTTPTLARFGATTATLCFFITFHVGCHSLPKPCPNSLQFLHGACAMCGAYGCVAFHHSKGLPSAFLFNGFEVDARHHTPTCPVMPPIMNMKIRDPRSPASGRMRFLDGTAAREFVFACIGVRQSAMG